MAVAAVDHGVPNQLFLVVTGTITFRDMMDAVATYRVAETRTWPVLFDVTEATVNFSSDDVRKLADHTGQESRKSPFGPVAIIASDDERFGLGRMFQTYSGFMGRSNVGVFRTREAAQKWLAAFPNKSGKP